MSSILRGLLRTGDFTRAVSGVLMPFDILLTAAVVFVEILNFGLCREGLVVAVDGVGGVDRPAELG